MHLLPHTTYAQTIVKKASAMLDGHSTIHRAHKLYYAYLTKNSGSRGPAPTGECFVVVLSL